MREIHELLNRRWIIKKEDPEVYFKLKDKYPEYRNFFRDKLGYSIIMNPLLIKAEKIPGKMNRWMGMRDFDNQTAYVFLCLVLMFLEEMDPEEQFVLSQITDYVKNQYPGDEPIDWTVYGQRKTFIKVLRFCTEEGIIRLTDGDDSLFSKSEESMEVLYENTGVSKYFMRRFAFDISEARNLDDIEKMEWQKEDSDRGVIRRHRVYRRLVMEPVVYNEMDDDQDYLYIKNQRSVIEHDMEKYLDGVLHIHRNGALVLFGDDVNIKDRIPNRKNISDIVLQACMEIRKQVDSGLLKRDGRDMIVLSYLAWDGIVQSIIDNYSPGWSKKYREASHSQIKNELNIEMTDFGILQISENMSEIRIMPVAGKFTGDYPKDFYQRRKDDKNGKMED